MQEAGQDVLDSESSLPNESRALNFHKACAEAITELEKLSGAEDRCLQIDDACQIMQACNCISMTVTFEEVQIPFGA